MLIKAWLLNIRALQSVLDVGNKTELYGVLFLSGHLKAKSTNS